MVSYFELDQDQQRALLEDAANQGLGPTAAVLEKDIWLCLVLQELFSLPDALPMVFKGGTSLSKVYGAIQRFSEDVDVTLDWRKLVPIPENFSTMGSTAAGRLSTSIREAVEKHLETVMLPALSKSMAPYSHVQVEFARDKNDAVIKDALVVNYPGVADYQDGYIRPSVLIEFGGRNDIEPEEIKVITPDVVQVFSQFQFPSAKVAVLSPIRTFWEKATLAHDETHRPEDKIKSSERQSRHWYDLFRLADHDIGTQALAQRSILEQVVTTKKRFFKYGFSQYDACLNGSFRLLPEGEMFAGLQSDYDKMVRSGMFYGEQVPWTVVEARLRLLEQQINTAISPPPPMPKGKQAP